MALTDTAIKQALPETSDYWLTDARGLRLLVKASGAKYWRLKYRFEGKQKTLALGVYPTVTLKEAREAVTAAKKLLDQGIDPNQARKKDAQERVRENTNTFSAIAQEWWEHQKGTWTPDHSSRIIGRLEADAFPLIGRTPIQDITPQDVIALARRIESGDALDVAARVLQDVRRVCRYAVQTGRLKYNP